MIIALSIQEPYKSFILAWQKTVEWRLNKGEFANLKIGDILEFEDTGEKMKVINLTLYPDFQLMLENEGLKHVLPWVKSIEDGIAVYHQFYTPAQEAEFGVLAIQIRMW